MKRKGTVGGAVLEVLCRDLRWLHGRPLLTLVLGIVALVTVINAVSDLLKAPRWGTIVLLVAGLYTSGFVLLALLRRFHG